MIYEKELNGVQESVLLVGLEATRNIFIEYATGRGLPLEEVEERFDKYARLLPFIAGKKALNKISQN